MLPLNIQGGIKIQLEAFKIYFQIHCCIAASTHETPNPSSCFDIIKNGSFVENEKNQAIDTFYSKKQYNSM